MKKIIFIILLLLLIGIIHDNMPIKYETSKNYEIMQATCEKNHGMWNDLIKECYFK